MKPPSRFALSSLVIGFVSLSLHAATEIPNSIPNPDPEFERQSFKIADGFQISLFAADPMIEKPIQINFDSKGRLWCATSETYPQLAPGKSPNDKIYILEDTTGSGKADKSTIFADGLFLPTAVVPGDDGAYVTNSTEILHLADTTGSGKADQRRVVLAGFGTEDTHHIVHTLRWGPDGKLYFIQSIYIHSHLETPHGLKTLLGSGVWRFDTRTLDLNVYSHGLINPWGIVWDRWGQTFETDGAGFDGIVYTFPGIGMASAVGYDKVMPGLNVGSPKYASVAVLDSSNMPDDFRGDVLTNDFRADRIVRFKLSDNGAGFTSKQMPDFLTSTDRAFRPIDLKMGPDGALYISDWYNPIINHGEVDFRDPRRDHVHGRIWRVTAINRPLAPRPNFEGATIAQLLDFLKSPEQYTCDQARLLLRERKPEEVLPVLEAWVAKIASNDSQADHERLEALWTCENLDTVNEPLLQRVLKSTDPHARAAAVRVIGDWAGQLPDAMKLLEPMVHDEYPRVRLEAVRALAQLSDPRAVVVATEALDQPTDQFLDYALWLTCTQLQPIWMPAYQSGKLAGWNPEHQNFALRAVGSPAALKALVDQLRNPATPNETRLTLIDRITRIGGPPEAQALFELALDAPSTESQLKAELLSALTRMARTQNVKAAPHPERIETLFDSPSEPVRAAALRLGGAWKRIAIRPALLKALQSPESSESLRAAAAEGLAYLGDRDSLAELRNAASSKSPAPVRQAAIIALTQSDLRSALADATALLVAGDSNPAPILAAVLRRDGGADALADDLKGKPVPADTAKLALRYLRGASTQNAKLIEYFSTAAGMAGAPIKLSPDQMKATIEEVLAKGDPARGERVFRSTETSCYQCHSIDGAGGWLAPDLSSIGASAPVDYLVNSVLDPNKDIKDGYDGYLVVTKSGDVFSGIKVSQDANRLVLRDNTHLELSIPMADIKAQKSIGSLMPNGLTDTLTHQEFIDLVRFLTELGKPGPYASSPTQYIRRWRVIEPMPAELASGANPSAGEIAALDGKDWAPAYSLVSGVLPMEVLDPAGKPVGYVRGEINVTAPGNFALMLNDAKGISLWVDDKPVNAAAEVRLDLPRGVHTLTFGVTAAVRGGNGLRVEVADVPGSTGHAQPVGGK